MDSDLVPQKVLDMLFPEDNDYDETPMFVGKCKKISRWNIAQERILILSTHFVYLLNEKFEIRKKQGISTLKYIVKSVASVEVLLYFTDETDIRLQLSEDDKDLFLQMLKLRFANLCPKVNLKVFGVPEESLKQYRSMNIGGAGHAYAFDNEPADMYRIREEEIQTQKEYDAEQQMNDTHNETDWSVVEQNQEDFDFDGRGSIAVGVVQNTTQGPLYPTSNSNQAIVTAEPEQVLDNSLMTKNEASMSLLENDDDFDNLVNHFDDMVNSNKGQQNRKLTDQDRSELRATKLVKNKTGQKEITFEDFNFLMVIGRGTFGKVFLAEQKDNKKMYAVKSIRKDILIQYEQVDNTILEKDIMFECEHPFLVGMEYLFQNDMRLYFVMPFVRGGELYKVFQSQKRFDEATVKFYAAQLVVAIGYLHMKGIVHRDLKLENVLVDQEGYLKIIDYGLAKMLSDGQETQSFCGTPEYLAPEMVNQTGHDKSVDWWAVGILIYEMLIGVTPFFNKNKNMLLMKIRNSKVVFPDRKKYKIDFSDTIMDLICRLLDKEKTSRLGSKDDFVEILSHPFFKDVDIEALENKQVTPPFKPNISNKSLEFFNVQSSKAAITDTYIPRENRKIVDANKDAFQGFNKRTKK